MFKPSKPIKPRKPKLEEEPRTTCMEETIFNDSGSPITYTIQDLIEACRDYPLDDIRLEINCENVGYHEDDYTCCAHLYVNKEIEIPEAKVQESFNRKLEIYEKNLKSYEKETKQYPEQMIAYNAYLEKQKLKNIKRIEKQIADYRNDDNVKRLEKQLKKLKEEK